MIWSITASRTFRKCQTQWYFKHCVASATATKDPARREAYLLSQLQSVSAWRGSIVDRVIEQVVVPALRERTGFDLIRAQRRARELFDLQLAFAKRHPLRQPGFAPSKAGDAFAAFHAVEYGGSVPAEETDRAWAEILLALENLAAMRPLLSDLRSAAQLLAQRSLTFPHGGVTVRAVPDLIAFYHDRPPLIVDWKVHALGVQEHWLQLGIYAVSLTRCPPHRDFPPSLSQWQAKDIRLVEVQLLTSRVREYRLCEADIEDLDDYISTSAAEMLLATGGRPNAALRATDFTVAESPDLCQRCPFRRVCWKDDHDRAGDEHLPDHEPRQLDLFVSPLPG